MLNRSLTLLTFIIVLFLASCSSTGDAQNSNTAANAKAAATPSSNFTSADVAKLKWIEGTWRGMDGDKPFYERYKVLDDAIVVESLKEDGTVDGEAERFELTRGEFGKGAGDKRSAASEITDTYVQFVPATPEAKMNSYRFERQSGGTWIALLEWPASGDKPAGRKLYRMEPWQPNK